MENDASDKYGNRKASDWRRHYGIIFHELVGESYSILYCDILKANFVIRL